MPLSRRARIDFEDKDLRILSWYKKRIEEERLNKPPNLEVLHKLERTYKTKSERIARRGKSPITPSLSLEEEKKLHHFQWKLRHGMQLSKKETAFLFSFANLNVINKPTTARASQGVKQLHDVKQKRGKREVCLGDGE